MRNSIGRAVARALAGLGVLAVLALPDTPRAAEPQRGGTLQVGFSEDAKTLDPTFSIQWSERQVLYLVYNTLLRMGTDFSLQPELAESWDIEEDGTRIVFHLREGVTFHDGTEFNAEVVKFNLERRMDEEVGSPQRKQLEGVVDSVEVIDAYTVAINTTEPSPPLLGFLAERPGFMVSPAAVEKYGEDFGSNPVGTGPFVFKEWSRGSRIVVERNPDYWEEGLPYLDSVVFNDVAGAVVGIQRLQTGEIDYMDSLSPQNVQLLDGVEGIRLDPITVGRWYSYQWQWQNEPFNDPTLRKAIAHAIDRDRLNEATMGGKATISDGPTPPSLWWFNNELEGYEYDPEKARALLEEADATGMSIKLSTPTDPVLRQLNQLVQEQLNAVGLEVELDPVAQSEWYSRVVEGAINFTPMRWTQRPDPDGLLSILFHSEGYANSTGYDNPEVDRLLEEARTTFDRSTREELYDKAQAIILEDLPYVPIYFSVEYAAMRDRVQGFEWTPDQVPRFYDVWLSE
jgi:peptide/nickel transport system substrate-binding protein